MIIDELIDGNSRSKNATVDGENFCLFVRDAGVEGFEV